MGLRLLRMCLEYIQGRRCTFHSHCRKYYRSVMQDPSTALVELPFLAVNFFPIKSFLAYTFPIYTITTRATINIASIGNLFLALVTLITSIAHACAFADFTSALVRTGAVRQHHHQQSLPPDKFSSRQAGRFAVLVVHLEMTSP
ncbi:hypothetical protein PsorP6_003549 [Peronosclerospora sorghi]|uniref:Uncharacterized protein n=1 Tax=Peronosclerospora sorghi TaxID=230839 RepID=A0ACC0VPS6_9STRA|nr:hypothetical protein PsorP6_003549 [Peronosclerospora sorghi]